MTRDSYSASDPYPPLRPQPGRRPPPRSVPPLLLGGVAALLLVALVLLVLMLTRGNNATAEGSSSAVATASASASGSGSASAAASESATTAPSESASAAATVAPSAPEPLVADSIVETTVDRLSVRAGAGTGEEKRGSLELGAQSFVVAGPQDADGFAWYLISTLGLPPNTGCAGTFETDPYNCPAWFGWVAGVGDRGEQWLRPDSIECPEAPFTAEALILARTDLERLACQGGDPFTFRAWWPEEPAEGGLGGACAGEGEPSGWLLCPGAENHVTISESEGFGGIGASFAIDPASGVSMPARGTWVELTVHMDDPAAQGCGDAAAASDPSAIPEQQVLTCRARMVVEAVSAVGGP